MAKAVTKPSRKKKSNRGRPKIGRVGFTVKMMPEIIEKIDKDVAALNKHSETQLSRSEWLESAATDKLKK